MTSQCRDQTQRRFGASMAAALLVGVSFSGSALAGPFILDLTDADDHGHFDGTNNVDGWFYMQRVLENLSPGVANGNKTVVSLGSTNYGFSGDAYDAAQSAYNQSSLVSDGWNWVNIDGASAISDFFSGASTVNVNNTGIIQIDSGGNVSGGIGGDEIAAINTNAGILDSFLGGGGALHSMAEGGSGQYGWLSTLVPGLAFSGSGGQGLALTADGQSAFPGLSDADLSAGPFHGHWTEGFSDLTTLFADSRGNAVGIGSSGGSITNPNPPSNDVPEPPVLALFLAGVIALFGFQRRRHNRN